MATRYVSDTDHIKAYLEYDEDDGCYFRISSMAGGVLSRSSNIGGPIVNGQGGVALDNSGAPKYPEIPAIDDGQWHTMQLSAEEQVVRFWLDGRLIAAAQNTDGVSGTVALTTRQQEMEWRDISVWAAPW
jgi:hypothetical protein